MSFQERRAGAIPSRSLRATLMWRDNLSPALVQRATSSEVNIELMDLLPLREQVKMYISLPHGEVVVIEGEVVRVTSPDHDQRWPGSAQVRLVRADAQSFARWNAFVTPDAGGMDDIEARINVRPDGAAELVH